MQRSRVAIAGALALAVGVLSVACSVGGLAVSAVSGGAVESAGGEPLALSTADLTPAADFRFPLYQGQEFLDGMPEASLADLRGKAVVLNFWVPLCPPCRAEMPEFEALWQRLQPEDVVVLGVDVGPFTGLGDRAQAVALLDQIGVTYPTGQATSAGMVRDYRVLGMPTTAFITPDGRIAHIWSGALNGPKLEELTAELLRYR